LSGFFFSGRKLRDVRVARGRSREQLAVEIGRTANAIVRYETGHGQPSIETLAALGAALGVDPRDLIVSEVEAVAE
jgi:transcriptional regulator with XRE-family HTH domain